ncbi:MAG: HAMP domain-containing histidine kinase [Melioribacteraceae bacterium]|nr:HAMP domain-containing histidine kinase [Melioribacteraceae bacterium]MCF8353135.1 HAMP domain-containing histidine kinase [Melioribacteraceae bacterium]MCF8396159.1 HAMP domain-containing histidine kinase [Melioribacteraceae bacterium]MCF8418250.1 HAMP domain-containing histidine kinase [Melioribacteraceae bacterium]
MLKTVKSKFIFYSLLFIITCMAVPFYFLTVQFRENFHQRSQVMLDTTLDMLNYGLNNAMMLGFTKNVQHIVEKLSSNNNIEHIRIIDKNGLIKYANDVNEVGRNIYILSPSHIEKDLKKITERSLYLKSDDEVYAAFSPIKNLPECQDCHGSEPILAYLDVDTDLTLAEVYFYTGSAHITFLIGAVILVLIVGYYLIFNFFVNKPVQRFLVALDAVEAGDLSIRMPAKSEDEFGTVEKHFNRMVNNLQNSKKEIEELHYEQLQRADKLVTLGELTAEMAHEINNHVGIIMSRADYLQMEIEDNAQMNIYNEDLDVIVNQIQNVSKITGSILKHGKKLSKVFHDISINKVIEDGLNIIEPILRKREIILTKIIPEKELIIYGDPFQLEQAITNLIINAIDAMENGGKLTLKVEEENDDVFVFIKDNGIGIDEYNIEKIFSPFFTTKSAEKGTGLGLYIVKNIINNHNAEIFCESKVNEGTEFKIKFNLQGKQE